MDNDKLRKLGAKIRKVRSQRQVPKHLVLKKRNRSGLEIEEEVLGKPRKRKTHHDKTHYIPFRDCMVEAIQTYLMDQQKEVIQSPKTELAQALYETTLEKIRDRYYIARSSLYLFPTIGTWFDVFYGVDAVFLFNKTWFVTIDISMRQKGRFKADVLINPSKLIHPAYLNTTARTIADALIQKRDQLDNARPLPI